MDIIVIDFISLDGVVQAPGGQGEDDDGGFAHGGWSAPFFDEAAMGPVIGDVMSRTDALLFGRRTWAAMANAWPGRAGDPFADSMNAIRKYVVSRTLAGDDVESRWNNSTLLEGSGDGNAIDTIRKLREQDGRALQVWGSATLARQLLENDLVDELCLLVEPILLGGGKSIYPTDGQARPMRLESVTQADTGVLICTYRPVRG